MKKVLLTATIFLNLSLASGMDSRDEAMQLAAGIDNVTKMVRQELGERAVDATRVLIVGATGGGKSTLLHLLADVPASVKKDAKFGELYLEPKKVLSAVASGPDSVTTIPTFWHDPKGFLYCDCPGFEDSRGSDQEIINAFALDQLFTEPSRIKILLVTAAAELAAVRGGTFRGQLDRLTNLIPHGEQLRAGIALVITKISDRRLPTQHLNKVLSSSDPADGLLHFFAANPDRVFGFSFPRDEDLDALYGARDPAVELAKSGIRKFLGANSVVNPAHRLSLNDSSLLKLSLAVGKFCSLRFSLQEFAALISAHCREEKDVDKLRAWLAGIGVLMERKRADDTPTALVQQVRSIAPFSRPEILGKFGDILEKIDGFQYLQRFLRQVLKTVALKDEYRKVFAEESTLSLAGALNPILLANKVEVERLIQLAEAEKEKALLEKIGYVVGHHGLDPATSMIGTRSADVLKMNVFQRHSTVAGIYEKKLAPFGELLVAEELALIKSYVDATNVGSAPQHPDAIIGPMPDFSADWHRSGRNHTAWLVGGQHVANWVHHWSGGMPVHASWWNKWGGDSPGSLDNQRSMPVAASRYHTAVAAYNQAKAAYDAGVKNASEVEFPSTTFDVLVDKVNGFFKKLIP